MDEKRLIELYDKFLDHIMTINDNKDGREFEDDIDPTFANFIKWLRWELEK